MHPALWGGDPYAPEGINRPFRQVSVAALLVRAQCLDHLVANGKDRVQRGLWVLKDHRYLAAPDLPHLLVRKGDKIFTVKDHLARDDPGGGPGNYSQQGAGGHGLAATGFAHNAQRLSLPKGEAHPVNCLGDAPTVEEVGVEVSNIQDYVIGH